MTTTEPGPARFFELLDELEQLQRRQDELFARLSDEIGKTTPKASVLPETCALLVDDRPCTLPWGHDGGCDAEGEQALVFPPPEAEERKVADMETGGRLQTEASPRWFRIRSIRTCSCDNGPGPDHLGVDLDGINCSLHVAADAVFPYFSAEAFDLRCDITGAVA